MDFAFTPEQVALRQELREYFTALMTPEVEEALAETGWEGPLYKELVRQIGRDGWLGVGWLGDGGIPHRITITAFVRNLLYLPLSPETNRTPGRTLLVEDQQRTTGPTSPIRTPDSVDNPDHR